MLPMGKGEAAGYCLLTAGEHGLGQVCRVDGFRLFDVLRSEDE